MEEQHCPICYDRVTAKSVESDDYENYEPVLLKCAPTYAQCKHWFHYHCIKQWLDSKIIPTCACDHLRVQGWAMNIRSATQYTNRKIKLVTNEYVPHPGWFNGLFDADDSYDSGDIVVDNPLFDANLEHNPNDYADYQ